MTRARRGGEPVPISKLLRSVIARRGLGGSLQLQAVSEAYARAAGPELAARSRVKGLRGGVVTVETDSTALAYELGGFHEKLLLEGMHQESGAGFVTGLRFRVGAAAHGG